MTTFYLSIFFWYVVVGPSWRVTDEAGVRSEAVPDPERLSLGKWCHQSPKPAAQVTAGRVRQEAYFTPWWDRDRPVWVRGRILLLQVQVGSQLPFHLPSHPDHCWPTFSPMYCLTLTAEPMDQLCLSSCKHQPEHFGLNLKHLHIQYQANRNVQSWCHIVYFTQWLVSSSVCAFVYFCGNCCIYNCTTVPVCQGEITSSIFGPLML